MCPANVLESTIKQLSRVLRSPGCRKLPVFVKTVGEALAAASSFVSERVCPVFQVSNVTGEGLDALKAFLNVIRADGRGRYDTAKPVEFQITGSLPLSGDFPLSH